MRTVMRVLREPLAVFLLLGAGVFGLDRLLADNRGVVRVTGADVARLERVWRAKASRPPTAQELQALVNSHVREEILYREAMRLGLDDQDAIVRRRLAQKMIFVSEDLADVGAPPPEALAHYYREHAGHYRRPPRYTLEHVFFSTDSRGTAAAREAARGALTRLQHMPGQADWRALGDPFALQRRYSERSRRDLARLFGEPFAAHIGDAAMGAWRGPYASAYGVHLVRVVERAAAELPPLDAVRQRVLADWRQRRRERANAAFYSDLRERYRVEISGLDAAAARRRAGS